MSRPRRNRLWIGGLSGLVATPVATWLLGALLYGGRSTYAIGQGEGFVVFLVGVYLAPLGALLGTAAAFLVRPGGRTRWMVALLAWLAGILLALEAAIR